MSARGALLWVCLAAMAVLSACTPGAPAASDETSSGSPTAVAPDCPNHEGGACLGALTAETDYTTTLFHPGLTYSVPDAGWSNFEDLAGNFLLVPPGNDLAGVNASTADFIGVYTSVATSRLVGSEECAVELVPEVATPAEMVEWMGEQAVLDVTPPVETSVGGLSGLMVDVRTRPGAELPQCNDAGTVISVALLFSGKYPSSLDHGVVPGMTMRLYLLDYASGVLVIELSDIDAAPADLDQLSSVAEQFRFAA